MDIPQSTSACVLVAPIQIARTLLGPCTHFKTTADRIDGRRKELEAEQKRLVAAFAKGYLPEHELDTLVERIRAELQTLPPPQTRSAAECAQAAIVAGETLSDMASYWDEALPEERRDIVWALLTIGGLVYDLERRVIVGLIPRPDMLHVLALGLSHDWEQRSDGLWLRQEWLPAKLERSAMRLMPEQHKLNAGQREEARRLMGEGKTLRQVAAHFGVSRMAIWRLMNADKKGDDD